MGSGYGIEQRTFARNLIRLLAREKIDLLHVQDPLVALLCQNAQQRGRIKTRTILAHGTEEPFTFLHQFIYLQHLAPWHLDEARRAGYYRDTWTTLPNFIDTDHFRPGRSEALRSELGIPADGLVVLAVAAIKRRHKRIDYLVREFQILTGRCPDLPAWLVVAGGREPQTEEVIAEATHLLGDRVRFLVRFPRPRMAELYRAADLFTLGSLKEMMPMALLEALASGLPCVVHQHPVMQWMVGPGGRGTDLTATGGWADAVAPLLRDPPRRAALGQHARAHCLQHFSRDRVVDQIVDYYNAVLNKPDKTHKLRDGGQL